MLCQKRTEIEHSKMVANDLTWREMQRHAFACHRIHGFPSNDMYRAWTNFTSPRKLTNDVTRWLRTDRASELKKFVNAHPLAKEDRIIEAGKDVQEEERRRLALLSMSNNRKSKKGKDDREESAHRKEVETVKHVVATREKQDELHKEYLACLARMKKAYEQDEVDVMDERSPTSPTSPTIPSAPIRSRTTSSQLLVNSPLAGLRVRNSTSTKLDYIINEVNCFLHHLR